ncbi:MAG: hypothetical protein INH37_11500 [Myxococcaceae bacterium]|nr:hypothetical protein [Myxococcaceae bacterium]
MDSCHHARSRTSSPSSPAATCCSRCEVASAPLATPTEATRVELGPRLFHEPALSLKGEVSCASCHPRDRTPSVSPSAPFSGPWRPAPLDDSLEGRLDALDATQRRGPDAFVRGGCVELRAGRLVGGERFERLGGARPWPDESAPGRYEVTGSRLTAWSSRFAPCSTWRSRGRILTTAASSSSQRPSARGAVTSSGSSRQTWTRPTSPLSSRR